MKRKLLIALLAAMMLLGITVAAEATIATKAITVDYTDLNIYVNGVPITLQPNEEPFIYNDRTFVPIRFVAEALGQTVEWVDATKTVKITDSVTTAQLAAKDLEIAQLKAQLTQKDSQIAQKNAQLAQKDAQIKSLEEDLAERKDGSGDINELEDDLNDDYDEIGDVSIDDISLDGDEDDVEAMIEVDLEDYDREWEDLADRDIEDFLDDLVSDIQDEFSEDTYVSGKILDIDSDDTLVKFKKDGDDDLDIDYYDDDYRDGRSGSDVDDVIDDLERDSYYIGNLEFDLSISYDEDSYEVTAKLDNADDDASSDWDDLTTYKIERGILDICRLIVDDFEDDADEIVDYITVRVYDEDGDFLAAYDYDVYEDELFY